MPKSSGWLPNSRDGILAMADGWIRIAYVTGRPEDPANKGFWYSVADKTAYFGGD